MRYAAAMLIFPLLLACSQEPVGPGQCAMIDTRNMILAAK